MLNCKKKKLNENRKAGFVAFCVRQQKICEAPEWISSEYKPRVLRFGEPATVAVYAEVPTHHFY